MDIGAYLERSPLFAGLEPALINAIAEEFEPVSLKAGDIVFREGDREKSFYLIARGEVVILKGSGVSQRELRRLGAGHGFGEMALVAADAPRSATIATLTETLLLRLHQNEFLLLMDREERFAQRMLRMITRRLRRADEMATQDLMRAHQGLIISLAQLAESRDSVTGAHLFRVRDYCTLLANLMARDPRFKDRITPGFIEAIYHVSPLHDIGKVAIPDRILMKNGKLTAEEFEIIKMHPVIGAHSIDTVLEYCDLEMFRIAHGLVLGHHEHYDGGGYPRGLKGDQIPLAARIMSIADFYDALLSERSYKAAFCHDRVIAAIREESGKKFDPEIAEIMLDNVREFEKIHRMYADRENQSSCVE